MDKEKVFRLIEEIDLWKRVIEGNISSIQESLKQINERMEKLNKLFN
jgi:hypothetical protein